MVHALVDWTGNFNATITPFTKEREVDFDGFRSNIDFLISCGIDGVIVCGCTGEFWSLTDQERVDLFRAAKDEVKGRVPLLGHISHLMYQNAVDLARSAEELDLDGVMLSPPYASLPTPDEILAYYELLCRATKLPVMVYNVPRRHGYNLSPSLLNRLADVRGVAAIKQSSSDFTDVVETVRIVAGRVRVLTGRSIVRGYPARLMGVDGFVSSDDPLLLGREAVDLWRLASEGNPAEVLALQHRCIAINKAIHDSLGTPPAALKAAMNLLGRPGGYPRPPILPLDEGQMERLNDILVGFELL